MPDFPRIPANPDPYPTNPSQDKAQPGSGIQREGNDTCHAPKSEMPADDD